MSIATRAASRSAGRGTSLATSPRPTPVTQLLQRREPPVTRSAAGRGTSLKDEQAPTRSSLTSSVLRRRDHARGGQSRATRMHHPRNSNSNERPYYEEATSGGRDDPNSKRKINDWYSSAARREALAGLAQATSELEEASKRSREKAQVIQPFAWADLSDVVNQLPDGHWAHGYVNGVANSIERNDAMDGNQKEQILGEVLQALGRLSREDDERFQDAES